MLTKILEKTGAHYGRMSRREQSLALAVAGLLGLFACATLVQGTYGYVKELDNAIDRLQEDIVNYKYSIAHRQEVDALYARVAKQHSSEWSEAEIHDRLRQEIYRLAQLNPPQLDENGIPVRISTEGGALVDIPTLRQGVLMDSGGEFREYQLGFRVEQGNFEDVLAFIERLQNSPQSLRIDDLVISGSPTGLEVSARMNITRTVVSGEDEEVANTGSDALWSQNRDTSPLTPEAWTASQCKLAANEEFAFHDEPALEAVANAPGSAAYFLRDVESGFSYDMYIEVSAFGACKLGIADTSGVAMFDTPYELPDDGKPYRYHLRFTVPGDIGGSQKLRTPALLFDTADSRAVVSRLIIKKAMV